MYDMPSFFSSVANAMVVSTVGWLAVLAGMDRQSFRHRKRKRPSGTDSEYSTCQDQCRNDVRGESKATKFILLETKLKAGGSPAFYTY
jgi:hypothetical protein